MIFFKQGTEERTQAKGMKEGVYEKNAVLKIPTIPTKFTYKIPWDSRSCWALNYLFNKKKPRKKTGQLQANWNLAGRAIGK